MQLLLCPECGAEIELRPDEVEVHARVLCEACYSTLEIVSENPLETLVIEEDDFDDDDFDEDDL